MLLPQSLQTSKGEHNGQFINASKAQRIFKPKDVARKAAGCVRCGEVRQSFGKAIIDRFGINSQRLASSERHCLSGYDGDLTIFSTAIEHSGLADVFNGSEEYTVFAPSDTALRNEGMDFLLGSVLVTKSNRDRLNVLLSYHIVRGVRLVPETIMGHIELTTLLDQSLSVVRAGTAISVAPDSANSVVTRRIASDDGVIFIVDRLIWPNWETWPENVAVAER